MANKVKIRPLFWQQVDGGTWEADTLGFTFRVSYSIETRCWYWGRKGVANSFNCTEGPLEKVFKEVQDFYEQLVWEHVLLDE